MKPRERRERLFKKDRPNIRPMELLNEDKFGKDMSLLWAAYKMGTFDLPEASKEDFADLMIREIEPYPMKWIIEDHNSHYKDGYGAVGMMCAVYNGWEIEPHFEPFSWATPRNTLRSVVSFLQMMRYDKDVGIVNVYSLEDTQDFYRHVSKYGVLNYAAKIPHGDVRGDRYLYYVRGKKNGRID